MRIEVRDFTWRECLLPRFFIDVFRLVKHSIRLVDMCVKVFINGF